MKEKENKNMFEGILGDRRDEESRQKAREKAKQKKKENHETVIEYTEKERDYINKYLPKAKKAYDEKEIYEIIKKFNFDDDLINKDIKHQLDIISLKGEEYGWSEVKKKEIKQKANNIEKKQIDKNKGRKVKKLNNNNIKGRFHKDR